LQPFDTDIFLQPGPTKIPWAQDVREVNREHNRSRIIQLARLIISMNPFKKIYSLNPIKQTNFSQYLTQTVCRIEPAIRAAAASDRRLI
jgi:hypothetical protein